MTSTPSLVYSKISQTAGSLASCLNRSDFDKSKFMKKGDFDPDNGYEVRADCYNLYIEDLRHVFDVVDGVLHRGI